jgi:hypothetical protein
MEVMADLGEYLELEFTLPDHVSLIEPRQQTILTSGPP